MQLLARGKPAQAILPETRVTLDAAFYRALLVATGVAIVWWLLARYLGAGEFEIWVDQRITFLRGYPTEYLLRPYDIPGYFNAPWGVLPLLPFNAVNSLDIGVLLQLVVYFCLLATVVYKAGGKLDSLLIALTSPLAIDSALELNIDWIVCVGLVVPPMWSGPFLAVKPQTAFGYVFSFTRDQWVRAIIVGLVVILISLLVWGFWIPDLLESTRDAGVGENVNLAPMSIITPFLSIPFGLWLLYRGIRRRDIVYCVVSGVFLTPYIAGYSTLPAFALAATRWRGIALFLSVCVWLLVALLVIV